MMHFTSLAILAGSMVATSLAMTALPATAQNRSCGPAVCSNEQQRYVGVPCTHWAPCNLRVPCWGAPRK